MKFLIASVLLSMSISLASGQKFTQLKASKEPLVLESTGSFYVGGNSVLQTKDELGNFAPGGHVTVGQMYVQYMKPYKRKNNKAFVLIHGMTLNGKTYETTPDGRMGWYEYLVRKGHDTYVVDQYGVGRSGFDSKIFNDVRAGKASPDKLPVLIRIPDENVFLNFRIGSLNGRFDNAKLSSDALTQFSKESVPFKPLTDSDHLQNYRNFSMLSSEIKHTILVSHSQSGPFPISTALLNSKGIIGAVLLEPAPPTFTDEDAKKIAKIPFLVIYGDNLNNDTGMSHRWEQFYTGWNSFIEKVNRAGGNAKMIYLPDSGIHGNGHMLMQEDNNLQIADIILKWSDTLQ